MPQEVINFGIRIKKLRVARAMSQMDVGAALNIDKENIRKYEKGLQEPKLSTIVRFARVFEVSLDDLIKI